MNQKYLARRRHKLMRRLQKELIRYEKFGNKNRLLNFLPKIGRILSKQFSKGSANELKSSEKKQYFNSFSPIKDFEELLSDLWYYSDRWSVWRWIRVKSYLKSLNIC